MERSSDGTDCHFKEMCDSCIGLPAYEHEGTRFCVLHLPSEQKKDDFQKALDLKLGNQDFNFAGTFFPSDTVQFKNHEFVEANFSGATFCEATDFSGAQFSGEWTNFSGAQFSGEKTYFSGVVFDKKVDFSDTAFNKAVDFFNATFKEEAVFRHMKTYPRTALTFQRAVIEKPERCKFHVTHLRPSWFVDVDARKIDFSDVEWFRMPDASEPDTEKRQRLTLENEIEILEVAAENEAAQSLRLQNLRKLTKCCRNLMINAEENPDYPTANEFHYWSMEALRKEGWTNLGLIATLYWALSGYGERPRRAFGILVVFFAVFAVLYMLLPSSPFSVFSDSDFCQYEGCVGQAVAYSLSALARITPAEPKLSPGWFHFLVVVEGLLGPLQIALFLLAVRRKVIR